MYVNKVTGIEITCPHCGSKITMTMDEFKKYRDETADYAGFVITCQRKDEDGKNRDIDYTNINCPACSGYIPTIVSDEVDSDVWGFCHSNCVKLTYGSYDRIEIEDFIKNQLGADEEGEV